MHFLLSLIALLLLIPAALAGIGSGLVEALANLDCVSTALPHASALLAEIAPMAPGILLLLAGIATLGLAGWLIIRIHTSD